MIRTLGLLSFAGMLLLMSGCTDAPLAGAADATGENLVPGRENVAQVPVRPGTVQPAAGRNEEVKSPLVRSMLDALDGLTDQGTDEEHGKIRTILLDADEELHRTLESDLTQKIRAANQRPDPFRGKRPNAPPGTVLPPESPVVPPVTAPEVRLETVPPVDRTPEGNAPGAIRRN